VFGPRHVVGGAAVQVAARKLFLIQRDQFARSDAFRRQLRAFPLRAVAINDTFRLCECADFINPSFDRGPLASHESPRRTNFKRDESLPGLSRRFNRLARVIMPGIAETPFIE
jgi:hypothetical protein